MLPAETPASSNAVPDPEVSDDVYSMWGPLL
uniref:Uncharacterized protein MANES_10G063200 n=1 Tax=Rhizophora mucronata TaxID=61149 RepID=A0A2P2IMD1_RHIMU